MKYTSALRGTVLAIVFSAMALSCELSSSFLSESERSALYEVELSSKAGESDSVEIENGAYIDAGAALSIAISKLSGAGEVAYLDFIVEGTDVEHRLAGPAAKTLTVPGSDAAAADAQSDDAPVNPDAAQPSEEQPAASQPLRAESIYRLVPDLEGTLPPLVLPPDLAPGAYRLSLKLASSEGKSLQKLSIIAFIGLPLPTIDSVTVFPPSIEPSQAVLLAAALEQPIGDPWLRWSRDGMPFAEGLFSEELDRVVWTAPRAEGAYSLSLEVFPAAPPDDLGFPFRAAAVQDLKAMVKASPGGSADEFADPLSYLSLLRLDGTFDDMGVRSRESQPVPFGKPRIDVYSGGFGYRFGEGAGIQIPGLMPPASQDAAAAFSLVFRLAPAAAAGRLARFASGDGSYALDVGLDEGRPYVAFRGGVVEEEARSYAAQTLPLSPRTIVVCLRPGAESTLVSWNFEGEPVEAENLPPLPVPPAGDAALGGPGSVPGVYDAFGLMSPSGPARPLAPASYRLAMRRRWKSTLYLAEGFEDGLLPPQATAEGGLSPAVGSLRLEGAASVGFAAALRGDRPFVVEAELSGDLHSVVLALARQGGAPLFSVNGEGEVFAADGKRLGALADQGAKLALLATPSRGSLLVSGLDGKNAIRVAGTSGDATYTIGLSRAKTDGSAALHRILARDATVQSSR
jgi:hypothetical protein